MNILGVGGLNHDPAVAIITDQRIEFAIESERVTRHKHEVSFLPHEAIEFSLEQAGMRLGDVDVIATNWAGGVLANRFYVPLLLKFMRAGCYPWSLIPILVTIGGTHKPTFFMKLRDQDIPPIVPVPHHLAHLGSCYSLSPFEEAAVAVIDGSGELSCTSLYHCKGRRIRKLYSMDLPLDSLGHVYTMGTMHLGYALLGEEYKVMGLAAYGTERAEFTNFFTELIELLPEGRYRVNKRLVGNYIRQGYRFPPGVTSRIGAPRRHDEPIADVHMDFAYAMQQRIEAAIVHIMRHLKAVTRAKRVCVAGGVAFNCVANGKWLEAVDFEEYFIQPAAGDAGTALGAAAYHAYHTLKGPRPGPFVTAYLGPEYSNEQVESDLRRSGMPFERVRDSAATAAQLIAGGCVIGWFQGRAEFGPRALGNRSILADPRDPNVRDRINRAIKGRELYRPLAPSILVEYMSEYFEVLRNAPYMLVTGKVRAEVRGRIPAVVHVDDTARPQSVSATTNPKFYQLIASFWKETRIPVVLNTSFNLAGDPIVTSPRDAIATFYASGLDALVIGDFLIRKERQSAQFAS